MRSIVSRLATTTIREIESSHGVGHKRRGKRNAGDKEWVTSLPFQSYIVSDFSQA